MQEAVCRLKPRRTKSCGCLKEERQRMNYRILAEHHEIVRIPNIVRTGKLKLTDIPSTFRLGTGHVRFFANKLGYLLERYKELHQECLHRGFTVQNYSSAWNGVPVELMGHYTPTVKDKRIIRERIRERISS